MNELQIFNSPDFGTVRAVELDGEPWLVGRDVAAALGYSNSRDALAKRVDEEDKGVAKCDTPGGVQDMTVINESGLYALVLSSRLPGAKRFRRWVTSEVLPSIRKTGGYIAHQEELTEAELMAKALLVAQKTIQLRDQRVKQLEEKAALDAPKVAFADSVSASNDTILIGELAKLMRKNGVDIGEKRLFKWMRDEGYLIKRGAKDHNAPTQYAMEHGFLTVKEVTFKRPGYDDGVRVTPLVTGKGQMFFIN